MLGAEALHAEGFREEPQAGEHPRQIEPRPERAGVRPSPDVFVHRAMRVQLTERLEEASGLAGPVHHDLVLAAPPDLETRARGPDRRGIGQGAALRIELRNGRRRTADLPHRKVLHVRADVADPLVTDGIARKARIVAVLEGEVDDAVDGGGPGEEVRVLADEEQRLLSTHRSSDRVLTAAVDVHPWECRL